MCVCVLCPKYTSICVYIYAYIVYISLNFGYIGNVNSLISHFWTSKIFSNGSGKGLEPSL